MINICDNKIAIITNSAGLYVSDMVKFVIKISVGLCVCDTVKFVIIRSL